MKRYLTILLTLCCVLSVLVGCSENNKEEKFHDLVSETQDMIDILADDIYSCWYDYVYEAEYDDVDEAIDHAFAMNTENLEQIEENTEEITALYGKIKNGKRKDEVREVMQAYNAYYSLVVEVSGSYNSYSAEKEALKKELSAALKNLAVELA